MPGEREALATWLRTFDFQIFATWTFGKKWPEGPTPEAVRYHVSRWIEEQELSPSFFVVEQGTSGQRRWHAHGLLGAQGSLRLEAHRTSLWKDWKARYGAARFDKLHPATGVADYCAKYCFKNGLDVRWFIDA